MKRREFMRAMVATVVAGPSVLAAPPTMFSLTPSAKAMWGKDLFDYTLKESYLESLFRGSSVIRIPVDGGMFTISRQCGNSSLDALMRRLNVDRITVDGGIVVFPSKK